MPNFVEDQPGAVPVAEERSLVGCASRQMADDAGLGVDPRIEARLLSARRVGWHGESVTGKRLPGGRRDSLVAVESTEGWGSTPPLRTFQGWARDLAMLVGAGFTPAPQSR